MKKPIAEIKHALDEIRAACDCITVDDETIDKALDIHQRFGYSYFDCLMIASALECGCDYLFSEDLQNGQVIDGLTIVNIFNDKNFTGENALPGAGRPLTAITTR
jgi:predicted nucleic acid-binding protein